MNNDLVKSNRVSDVYEFSKLIFTRFHSKIMFSYLKDDI